MESEVKIAVSRARDLKAQIAALKSEKADLSSKVMENQVLYITQRE